jgi:hypothetical protein
MNLRELLKDWEDQDISAYYLACCLGLMNYDATFTNFRDSKHVFWSGNSISKFLYNSLNRMSKIGMLEFDGEKGFYRWNETFDLLEESASQDQDNTDFPNR